ncbi:hypothetical protein G6F43_010075 [Rhizopus delemar]|nr:hypothetical protein G6F43_010075 [Rhizopus delemar]
MSALSTLGSFSPLLIEIQNTIDSQFLQRLIGYSLNVMKVHKILSVVLVFGVHKISPSNLLLEFTPSSDQRPWLFSFPCTMWAKHCYLVSKETMRGQNSDSPLNSVMALSLFLAEQQPSLYLHTHPHDPTIIQLYKTAFALVCHYQLFKRTIDKISSGMDMDRTKRICERGIEYNREVKHRLLNESSSNSSQELEYPDRLQLGPLPKKKPATHTMSNQAFEFVQHFKNKSTGRMNWKLCLQMGPSQSLLRSFTTSENLVTHVHFSQKPFHLVIIDYAGRSTSPNDIRIFLEQCSNIKEVVVDHGSPFEILSRFDLLKNNDLEKFKCRHANVKRSK